MLQDTGVGRDFKKRAEFSQHIKPTFDNEASNLLCSEGNRLEKVKTKELEIIFAGYTSSRELIFRIYKEHKTLRIKKTNDSIKGVFVHAHACMCMHATDMEKNFSNKK